MRIDAMVHFAALRDGVDGRQAFDSGFVSSCKPRFWYLRRCVVVVNAEKILLYMYSHIRFQNTIDLPHSLSNLKRHTCYRLEAYD